MKINPNDTDIFYNLANTLSCVQRYDDAIYYFKKVIQYNPEYYKVYYGLGLVYNHKLDYASAFKLFRKTLELKPDDKDAIFAISLIQLKYKNYEEGWKNYEARWEANNPLEKMQYNVKFYDGEDLTKKTILIQEEQGFGDNIQFIRYIEYLKEKKPKIIYVAVRKELTKLFKLIKGIKVVNDKSTLHNVDYFTSLMSLPRIFNTNFDTIPNKVPYLNLPKKDTVSSKVIKKTKKLKVGFAYQGNIDHANDYYRSIPIEIFKSLFEINNIEFYNLQVPSQTKDVKILKKEFKNIIYCDDSIKDFYDSALIINKLDLIISIDSALAHFAGALNKKVFILLPRNVEWRWFEGIDYSPWYPSAKLFRQKDLGQWMDTIEAVKKELLNYLPHQ